VAFTANCCSVVRRRLLVFVLLCGRVTVVSAACSATLPAHKSDKLSAVKVQQQQQQQQPG